MAYDNELTGVLFRNDRKETDKHPDSKGSCEIDGVQYWIAGWKKEGKNGPMLSLKFTMKDEQPGRAKVAPKTANPDADDDIPW